jgi:protein-disulfide isomerase
MKSIIAMLIVILNIVGTSCNYNSNAEINKGTPIDNNFTDKVIARLNGKDIYLSDLSYDFQSRYKVEHFKLEEKLYREQKSKIDQNINRILLEDLGITDEKSETLIAKLDTENLQTSKPILEDKEKLYNDILKYNKEFNKEFPGLSGMSEDEQLIQLGKLLGINTDAKDVIKEEVINKVLKIRESQIINNRKNELLKKLRSEAKIEILLKRPELIQLNMAQDDDPYLGSKDAKITIIEFADYQCPFCSKAVPVLKELLGKNKGKIKLVFRDLPLESHRNAKVAAEASECAHDQGKFWEYSEILFENQKSLDVGSLKKYAELIGLNLEKFNQCLDSGKTEAEVTNDITDARIAGLISTPSILVNGYYVSGIPTVDYIEEVIANIENHRIPKIQEDGGHG